MEFVVANLTNDLMPCRACTIEMNKYDMIHLYTEPNLTNIFIQCTSIKINKADNLPQFMCPDCNYQLIQLNDFRQKCHTSDSFFREQNLIKFENEIKTEQSESTVVAPDDVGKLDISVERKSADENNKYEPAEIPANDNSEDYDSYADNDEDIHKASKQSVQKPHKTSGKKDILSTDAFYCDICNQKFLVKHRIEAHLKEHFGLKQYVCNICDKGFVKLSALVSHKKKSHPDMIVHKAICKSKPVRSKSIKHTCDLCGKKFFNKLKLEGHLRQHQGLKPFECNLCSRAYNRIDRLHKHINAEHNLQKINCTYEGCDKTFNFKESLHSHIKLFHEHQKVRRQCLVCDVCGKSLPDSHRMREHSYTHTGEKPFSCDRCPKKFTSKNKLNLHTKRHDNIRNHVCTICGHRKTTRQELKVHLNFHTKEKTWPCSLCPMISASVGSSRAHYRTIHEGFRPYKCEYCEQSFNKKSTLQHHIMTHTGEKPHECTVCNKRFIQLTALKKHTKIHEKNVMLA